MVKACLLAPIFTCNMVFWHKNDWLEENAVKYVLIHLLIKPSISQHCLRTAHTIFACRKDGVLLSSVFVYPDN